MKPFPWQSSRASPTWVQVDYLVMSELVEGGAPPCDRQSRQKLHLEAAEVFFNSPTSQQPTNLCYFWLFFLCSLIPFIVLESHQRYRPWWGQKNCSTKGKFSERRILYRFQIRSIIVVPCQSDSLCSGCKIAKSKIKVRTQFFWVKLFCNPTTTSPLSPLAPRARWREVKIPNHYGRVI